LKGEQDKKVLEERARFIEKTKSLLLFENMEEEKPRKSGGKVNSSHIASINNI